MSLRCSFLTAIAAVVLVVAVTASVPAQLQARSGDALRQRILAKAQDASSVQLRQAVRVPAAPEAIKWPGYRLPDLRIGRWWYKAPPKVGRDVDLFFEVQNIGRGYARGPVLWEVTCHNWGFWNPVLNRVAVSYFRRGIAPRQSRIVHIRFRMTQRMHNLRLMADPSDRLGPPDNPPFGQKAKLYGWLSLKNGHIRESNERNNAKWVCIKVFSVKPIEIAEPVRIVIPVVNPLPGELTEVELVMGKELAELKDVLEVVVPDENAATFVLASDVPTYEPVEPGQTFCKLVLDPENYGEGEEEKEDVVLEAGILDCAKFDKPVSFKVLATATGPDGEQISAEVTVVIEILPVEQVSFN